MGRPKALQHGRHLTTRQVAKCLNVKEKMIYSLIAEKGLPASKVTGKWLFPLDLVRQWVENGTRNFPEQAKLPPYHGLVLISRSNDLLLDTLICTFNLKHSEHMALFGLFLAMLKGKVIQRTADKLGGYDLSMTGKMIYPETGNDDGPTDSVSV